MAQIASLWFYLSNPGALLANPITLIVAAFSLWMFVDAVRRREWYWAVAILLFWGISPLMYFFLVYRQFGAAGGGTAGFELPGAGQRKRIKELQSRIYHLDHARDHLDLADIHFAAGKMDKAEAEYRESLKRDPADIDAIAHLGQCLLRQKRTSEARPLLEQALARNPKHDYGHTQMAYAETLTALGENDAALAVWRQVLEHNAYARARVQMAGLLVARGEGATARRVLEELIADDAHSPKFQRGRDRVWIKRAKRMLSSIPRGA